jgi:hypothetical protein
MKYLKAAHVSDGKEETSMRPRESPSLGNQKVLQLGDN